MPVAIISALPEEQHALLAELQGAHVQTLAGRRFHHGQLAGVRVVLVQSGVGKVAAAITATLLLQELGARAVLFTGVAGGLGRGVQVGDVVVGEQFLQHDMDASPIFPRWVVPDVGQGAAPGAGRSHFAGHLAMAEALLAAAQEAAQGAAQGAAQEAAQATPRVGTDATTAGDAGHTRCHLGLIVSGDRFVSSAAESRALREALPEALAVDMESAAVAQVCADFGRPLAVLRSISDRADDDAHVDFPAFLANVAAPLAHAVVMRALPGLARLARTGL